MEDDNELLKTLLLDSERQVDIYRPGEYWRRSTQVSAKNMLQRGITNFRSSSSGTIGQGYADCLVLDPAVMWEVGGVTAKLRKWIATRSSVRKYFLRPYLAQIEALHAKREAYENHFLNSTLENWFEEFSRRHALPDTLVGQPESTITIGGQVVSKHYLMTLTRIQNFSSKIDFTKVTSVFEIGGGYGANAHLLMHLFPNIRKYLYLDIPPMLYVGTQYLKHFFHSEVLDYLGTRNNDAIRFNDRSDREIIAIAPWQIRNFSGSMDLCINFASMQEMSIEIVRNYAEHIKRLLHKDSKFLLQTYPLEHEDGVRLSDEKILGVFQPSFNVESFDPKLATDIGKPRHYFVLQPA